MLNKKRNKFKKYSQQKKKNTLLKICNQVIEYSVYSLVFCTPLFLLPITTEFYEFNKQYLLFFIAGLALMAWLARMVICQKRLAFKRTPLDLPILVFLAAMIISAIFSIDSFSSWMGFSGRYTDALVSLLAMVIVYFVIVNNLKSNQKIFQWFLGSLALVLVIACLSVLGFWSKFPWPEGNFSRLASLKSFNSVAASSEGLAVFLAAALGLVGGLFLYNYLTGSFKKEPDKPAKNIKGVKDLWAKFSYFLSLSIVRKIFYLALMILSVILLMRIDFWAAWIILGISQILFLVIVFWTRLFRKQVNLLILPIILLLISMGGFFVGTDAKNALPQEAILDFRIAEQVTRQAFKENPMFGSGPGLFSYSFAKFKPAEFNQDRFWNIRFDKSPSHLLELFSTIGIVGVLSYLSIIAAFLFTTFIVLEKIRSLSIKSKEGYSTKRMRIYLMSSVLFIAWLGFFIAQFIYLQNTVLALYFWIFLGLGMVAYQEITTEKVKEIKYSFKKLVEIGLFLNVLLLILVFVTLGLFYFASKFYLAEIWQAKGQNSKDLGLEQRIELLEKSVNLNKFRSSYRINLSRLYLDGVELEAEKIKKGEGSIEGQSGIQLLTNYISRTTEEAREARDLSPNLIASWENLGVIYRDLRYLVIGADKLAIIFFEQALNLEPNNPFFYRELCSLYLVTEQGQNWDKTIGYCQKAIDLKPNYLNTYIQLALAYGKKNDIEESIKNLEVALRMIGDVQFQQESQLANAVSEIYFHLGRLYLNSNNFDQAIGFFQRVVVIMPQHSNARYGLATALQSKGMFEEALREFEIVAQLNPENEIVRKKIKALNELIE